LTRIFSLKKDFEQVLKVRHALIRYRLSRTSDIWRGGSLYWRYLCQQGRIKACQL